MFSTEQFRERIVFKDAAAFSRHITLHSNSNDGTSESIIWDYKFGIDRRDATDGVKIAKDLCAFANTFGGTLFLGVVEKLNTRSEKTAYSINDQRNIEDVKMFINDNVLPIINPNIEVDIFPIQIDGNGTIIAVNVHPLLSTIASVDADMGGDHRLIFPYRTSYGNKFFSAEEIKNIMIKNTRQSRYLLRKYSSIHNFLDIATPVFQQPTDRSKNMFLVRPEAKINSNGFKEDYCELTVGGFSLNLPYEFIETIWSTAEQKIGLFLTVFVVLPEDRNGYARLIPSQTVNGKFFV